MLDQVRDVAHHGIVTIEGDYATIVFRRHLNHAPELVWDALTNPQELKKWLLCSSSKIEKKEGGSLEMVAGVSQFHIKGKVLAWNPPYLFEHEWKVEPLDKMPKGENAVFRYELERQGDKTLLTVTYRHLTQQTARGFAPGGSALMDRLTAQLNTEPLPDWMERFKEVQATHIYPEWNS